MLFPSLLLIVLATRASASLFSAAKLFVGGAAAPVQLDYVHLDGIKDDGTQTNNYLGIPYAKAPRFDHAQPYTASDSLGNFSANDYGPACPQYSIASTLAPSDFGLGQLAALIQTPILFPSLNQAEDCLSVNV